MLDALSRKSRSYAYSLPRIGKARKKVTGMVYENGFAVARPHLRVLAKPHVTFKFHSLGHLLGVCLQKPQEN
jgi:hypothetical protein